MNKKILLINASNPIDIIGGTQSSLNNIIPNLKKMKFDIGFISFNYKNKVGYYKTNHYEGIRLPNLKKSPFIFFMYLFNNFKYLKNFLIADYIWVHSPLPWFFFSLLFKNNSKIIYTIHGPLKKEILNSKSRFKLLKILISNFILKICIKNTSYIHCNSKYVYKESLIESNFIRKKNFYIEELLVDEQIFIDSIKNSKNKTDDNLLNKKFFLISRRLIPRTGVLELLELLKNNKFNNEFNFLITGSGPLEKKVKSLSNELNNVFFLGEVSEQRLLSLKRLAFGFIVPSVEAEGYCVLAKEARILDKFILHTNQGGLKESTMKFYKSFTFNIENRKSLEKSISEIRSFSKKILIPKKNNNFLMKLNILFK